MISFTRLVVDRLPLWATLCGLAFLAVAGAGCAGRPVPAPPRAVAEAERLVAQASKLQAEENWPGAADWWRRAGQQYQLLNRRGDVALARHNEGICRRAMGQLGVSHALLEEASAANRDLGRTNAWWRNQIALLQLENESDLGRASARLESLEPRLAGIAEPSLVALLRHEEARTRAGQGRLPEALSASARAAAAFQALGEAGGSAAVLLTRARIFQMRGDSVEAVAAWREALAAFERMGHPRGVAMSLSGLGVSLARGGGTREEAESILRRALENLAALKMEAESRVVQDELGKLQTPPGNAVR